MGGRVYCGFVGEFVGGWDFLLWVVCGVLGSIVRFGVVCCWFGLGNGVIEYLLLGFDWWEYFLAV